MKKMTLSLMLCSLALANVCNEVELRKHLPFMPESAKIISKKEVFGFCEFILQAKGPPFTMYATKDFVIAGDMLKEGKSLSKESIEKVQGELIKGSLPKLRELAATVYGAGEKEVFFISDPDCPFCQGIKKKVKELADARGYKVYLVWFPLPIHQKAKEKAVSFVCEKRNYDSYLNDAYGQRLCPEGIKKVEDALSLLESLVNATPTFILSNGRMIVGGSPKMLEESMK